VNPNKISELSNAEVAKIFGQLHLFEFFIKAIRTRAMQIAAKNPKGLPGYKVVEGQSRRRWHDVSEAVTALKKAGLTPKQIYDIKLKGITAIAKLIPVSKREKLMTRITEKPRGYPCLVPESDKRSPINSSAKLDFAEFITSEEE
jgi:hypothetical protein